MKSTLIIGAVLAVAGLGLTGCDNGPSAVQTRDRTAETDTAGSAFHTPGGTVANSEATAVTTDASATRRQSADTRIKGRFERNGASFGAASPEDYLAKVHAFAAHPPRDVDTARRPNGDTLYYQASTNTFAVVAKDGTPRTMFKPDDGPAYWEQQKSRAPTFGQRRSSDG